MQKGCGLARRNKELLLCNLLAVVIDLGGVLVLGGCMAADIELISKFTEIQTSG